MNFENLVMFYLEEKESQTDSKEFKAWFGNSKVIDKHGNPLKVYKGMYPFHPDTNEPLYSIDRQSEFPTFDSNDKKGVKISGFFTDDPVVAQKFCYSKSCAIFPVYLSLQNPYIIDAKGEFAGKIQFGTTGKPFRDAINSGKYDSVIIKNTKDEGNVYITLKANQSKSAIGNIGKFDINSPNLHENKEVEFGDSKIQQVVYHGTGKSFRKFNLKHTTQNIIWFTNNRKAIESGESGAHGKGYILSLLVDIKNPAGWDEYEKLGLGQLRNQGYDGVILPNGDETYDGFVFSPNQIKIIKKEKI